jgi:thymidylate synthase (FAD)
MSGTIRSWITYLQLRSNEDTQKEHRDIAEALKVIFKNEFPAIYDALF